MADIPTQATEDQLPENQQSKEAESKPAASATNNAETENIIEYADPDLEKEIKAKAEKLGVKVEELLMLPMTHEDILYLLELCPYLQIVNSSSNGNMSLIPKFIKAQSGWTIYDYGDAMSSSPGEHLFSDNIPDPQFLYGLGTSPQRGKEDEGTGGRGTMLKQAVDTAAEMVFLAIQRGWKGVTIVEGHPRMKWAAWVMAGDHDYELQGYEPSEVDVERRKRLRRSRAEIDEIYQRAIKGMKQA